MKFYPEGHLIDTAENQAAMLNAAALSDAMRDARILEARSIICDNEHNLIVDLKCMRGIIPREEGALGIREGTVRDIAIISRVNKPVCFVVTDFIRDAAGRITAVLSRRKAQERCLAQYISGLTRGDVIDVRITHLEPFGAFADIGCGIVSLLPIDAISVSRIDHPRERFTVGMDIRAVIRAKEENRITLSHKELLGTWTAERRALPHRGNRGGHRPERRILRDLHRAYAEPRRSRRAARKRARGPAGQRLHQEHSAQPHEGEARDRGVLRLRLQAGAARLFFHGQPYRFVHLLAARMRQAHRDPVPVAGPGGRVKNCD